MGFVVQLHWDTKCRDARNPDMNAEGRQRRAHNPPGCTRPGTNALLPGAGRQVPHLSNFSSAWIFKAW